MVNTLKAANWAARAFVSAGDSSDKDPPITRQKACVAFHTKKYRLRAILDPAEVPADLDPYLWPLKNSKSSSGFELTQNHLRLEEDAGKMVLTLLALPDDLEPGAYFAPITQGKDKPTALIGSVLVTVDRLKGQALGDKGSRQKDKAKKRKSGARKD
jgi:hypothetical protein